MVDPKARLKDMDAEGIDAATRLHPASLDIVLELGAATVEPHHRPTGEAGSGPRAEPAVVR